jgi:dienelactone hydrolase
MRWPPQQRTTAHYVVTGPVARFARQIAGQGYIVAAPSSYHDFTGPEPLAYDVPGTDKGNEWKIAKVGKLMSVFTSVNH